MMPTKKTGVRYKMRGVSVDSGVITIATDGGDRRVEALMIGEWAIHPRFGEWPFSGEWSGLTISHAPTGFGLGWLVDRVSMHEALGIIWALSADIPSGTLSEVSPKVWEWIIQAIVGEALGEPRRKR